MEHKRYTNEEVYTWWNPQPSLSADYLINYFKKKDEYDYKEPIDCMIAVDYCNNVLDSDYKVEHLMLGCRIFDAEEYCSQMRARYIMRKIPSQMNDRYDIYSDPYDNLFSCSPFYKIEDFTLRLKLSVVVPVFMQDSDKRIIQYKKEYTPSGFDASDCKFNCD